MTYATADRKLTVRRAFSPAEVPGRLVPPPAGQPDEQQARVAQAAAQRAWPAEARGLSAASLDEQLAPVAQAPEQHGQPLQARGMPEAWPDAQLALDEWPRPARGRRVTPPHRARAG